jgi:hypothetical protein
VTVEVHVHHVRKLAEKVVVQRALFDAAFLQRIDHPWNLGFEQDQITHGHDVAAADLLERRPRSKRKRRLDRDAVESDVQVAARKTHLVHIARQKRSGAAEGLLDILPIRD